jgi:Domain of unknown function (DUF4160)
MFGGNCMARRKCSANLAASERIVCARRSNTCIASQLRSLVACASDVLSTPWLDPVALASNYGFNSRELNEVMALVDEHLNELLEAWHEHLG